MAEGKALGQSTGPLTLGKDTIETLFRESLTGYSYVTPREAMETILQSGCLDQLPMPLRMGCRQALWHMLLELYQGG